MSQEALIASPGFRHLPRHDLESVYYVAIILGCLQDDGKIPEDLHRLWTQGSLDGLGNKKEKTILGPTEILENLAPRHTVLEPHLSMTFRALREFVEAKDRYTKTAAQQQLEDFEILDGLLQELARLISIEDGRGL